MKDNKIMGGGSFMKASKSSLASSPLLRLFLIFLSFNMVLVNSLESKPGISEQKHSAFMDENEWKFLKKQKDEVVIIFIGDSITEGQGSTERSKDSFSMIL